MFQRTEVYSTTFNKPKCHFGQTQITFYGYRFDLVGLKPTPEKVQAIHECEPLGSKTEVRSFLGMTVYLSKFIPRYVSLRKPLRDLTRTETKFHWGPTEDKAFKDPNYRFWYVWKLTTMKGCQRVSSSNLLKVGRRYISLVGHCLMWRKGTVRQKRMRCV